MRNGYRKDDRVCMFPCTWVDESRMLTKALDGALDNHACAEIGIKRGEVWW